MEVRPGRSNGLTLNLKRSRLERSGNHPHGMKENNKKKKIIKAWLKKLEHKIYGHNLWKWSHAQNSACEFENNEKFRKDWDYPDSGCISFNKDRKESVGDFG